MDALYAVDVQSFLAHLTVNPQLDSARYYIESGVS